MSDAGDPLLSVLVPTWNAAATIERALGSILSERAVQLECVVVDDASSDGTADVVAALAKVDPRVRLIRSSDNAGVSATRNRALDEARGEWIAFLDADDRLYPGAVSALMRPTDDPGIRAVVGQRIEVDGDRILESRAYDRADIRQPGRKSIATHPELMYYAAVHGKAFHRTLLDTLRFEGRVLGDQPWTIRALLRAGSGIEVIGDVVYEWSRPHPDRAIATITSVSRSSAGQAVRIVDMAPVVFAAVSSEIDAQVDDELTRERLRCVYFERLVSSDVRPQLNRAIERRDPATGDLFASIGRFLSAVPSSVLAASSSLGPFAVAPARSWTSLPPSARREYWGMLRPILRADRAFASRLPSRAVRLVISVAAALGPRLGPVAAGPILWTESALRAGRSRTRPPADAQEDASS